MGRTSFKGGANMPYETSVSKGPKAMVSDRLVAGKHGKTCKY
jgi:hypothetical protein